MKKKTIACLAAFSMMTACKLNERFSLQSTDDVQSEMSVTWMNLTEGTKVAGVMEDATCQVEVTGQSDIDRVEFFVDDTPLNIEKSKPYTCVVKFAQGGMHELKAIAFDQEGTAATAIVNVEAVGTNYYVNSSTGKDSNDGLTPDSAWQSVKNVKTTTFKPGDTVNFNGSFGNWEITLPIKGTEMAPIVFTGEGSSSGSAKFSSISLKAGVEHLLFRNFEVSDTAAQTGKVGIRIDSSKPIRFVRFTKMKLHDLYHGIFVNGNHSDVTFVNTSINNTWMDGISLTDTAGDRFSFIGGSIQNAGKRGPCPAGKKPPCGWALHGVYPSGGHGHLFDGVTFGNNTMTSGGMKEGGWSISMRRGNTTVRNCIFNGGKMLSLTNEDEGKTKLAPSGSPSFNLKYMVYRNIFNGTTGDTGIYHGGDNDLDKGTVTNPGNTWVVFNNTFINAKVNFGSSSGTAEHYNIYMKNNAFINSAVSLKKPDDAKAPGGARSHVLSNNGWWQSGSAVGSKNQTSNPDFNSTRNAISATTYVDSGTTELAPSVVMKSGAKDGLGYLGSAPDIGHNEN